MNGPHDDDSTPPDDSQPLNQYDPGPPPDEDFPPRPRLVKPSPLPAKRGNGQAVPSEILHLEDYFAFCERASLAPPLYWHAHGLFPGEGIVLFHGRPRSMKTLAMQECAYKLACGVAPFNAPRFIVKRPVKILYITEEDGEQLIYSRFILTQTGTALRPQPSYLFPLVRRGLTLDTSAQRASIQDAIVRTGAEIIFLEPMRSLTALAEKTSSEFKPILDWMRRVQQTTPCKTFVLGHHWRKPTRDGGEVDSRSDRAAGGALFSISDCLIAFEKMAWNKTRVIPEDYKLSADPEPFEATWESDTVYGSAGECFFGTWIKVIAATKSEEQSKRGHDQEALLKWLTTNPWSTARDAEGAAKIRKGTANRLLTLLLAQGTIDRLSSSGLTKLGKPSNTKLYAIAGTPLP